MQAVYVLWWLIAAQDDLFLRVVKIVEGVKKLFLAALCAGEKLNVVDEQQVQLAITFAEGGQVIALDGTNKIIDECFTIKRGGFCARVFAEQGITNGREKMRRPLRC